MTYNKRPVNHPNAIKLLKTADRKKIMVWKSHDGKHAVHDGVSSGCYAIGPATADKFVRHFNLLPERHHDGVLFACEA